MRRVLALLVAPAPARGQSLTALGAADSAAIARLAAQVTVDSIVPRFTRDGRAVFAVDSGWTALSAMVARELAAYPFLPARSSAPGDEYGLRMVRFDVLLDGHWTVVMGVGHCDREPEEGMNFRELRMGIAVRRVDAGWELVRVAHVGDGDGRCGTDLEPR